MDGKMKPAEVGQHICFWFESKRSSKELASPTGEHLCVSPSIRVDIWNVTGEPKAVKYLACLLVDLMVCTASVPGEYTKAFSQSLI